MGAASFTHTIKIPKTTSTQEAFSDAVDQARHDNGHAGYSGTLAEKNQFVLIHHARNETNAERIVHHLSYPMGLKVYREEMQELVEDKWGPAGAVRYSIDKENDGVIFFGFASS